MTPSGVEMWPVHWSDQKALGHIHRTPNGPMLKAVRCLLASVSSTCQYPDCKSRLVKIVAPSKQSKESSILGRLCPSLIVQLLSFPKSIQNCRLPSFLQTNTTVLVQGLGDHCIALCLTFPVNVSYPLHIDEGVFFYIFL